MLSPPTRPSGTCRRSPTGARMRTWPRFLARRTGVARAQRELDEATESLAAGAPGADDAYATALDRWLNLGGADLEERAAKVITTLGLRVDLDRAMTGLSGGQAARANLASLLLSRYDVFLLDEPTNDLDIAGLEILEDFVRKLRAATVLVSHDRAFLERTVDRVLELDLAQQKTRLYGGGYAGYLEERETARRHARENYEQYAETKAELEARRRTKSSRISSPAMSRSLVGSSRGTRRSGTAAARRVRPAPPGRRTARSSPVRVQRRPSSVSAASRRAPPGRRRPGSATGRARSRSGRRPRRARRQSLGRLVQLPLRPGHTGTPGEEPGHVLPGAPFGLLRQVADGRRRRAPLTAPCLTAAPSRPASNRSSVDFPAPLTPTSPITSPGAITRSSPENRVWVAVPGGEPLGSQYGAH